MNFLKNCLKNKSFVFGVSVVSFFLVLTIIGIFYTPNDPYKASTLKNVAPTLQYPFGTDNLGRCIFSRTLSALKWLFYIGFCSSLLSLVVGCVLGFLCYFKKLDKIIMFLVNALVSVPDILIVLAIISVFGTSTNVLICTIGFLGITSVIRVIRSNIIEAQNKDYVVFAKSLGVSNARILTTHLIGDIVPALIVTIAIRFSTSILIESGISYLGFSGESRLSIGQMTSEFSNSIFTYTYKIIPALILMLIVFAFYKISDGVLEVLNDTNN